VEIDEARPDHLLEGEEEHGAQHRPPDGPLAAEKNHDDHGDGHDEGEDGDGLDVALIPRGEAAHDAGGHRGKEEGIELVAEGVDAHRFRRHLVLPDGHEAEAEPRGDDDVCQPGHRHRGEPHGVVDGHAGVERGQGQPAAPARQPLEVGYGDPQHLVEAEHGDREVGALEAQAGKPDDEGEHDGAQPAREGGEEPGPAELGDEDACGVGAHAEEGNVAEGHVAREPGDEIPGLGKGDPHEELEHEAHAVARSRDGIEGEHDENDHKEREEKVPHEARPLSRPVGLTRRTSTSRTYATASFTWVVRKSEEICSIRPRSSPPSSAPG